MRPPREESFVFKKTKEALCDTTIDYLLGGEDVADWDYACGQAQGQLYSLYPGGSQLSMHSDLSDIVEGFHNGCYCRELAALAVLFIKQKAC